MIAYLIIESNESRCKYEWDVQSVALDEKKAKTECDRLNKENQNKKQVVFEIIERELVK